MCRVNKRAWSGVEVEATGSIWGASSLVWCNHVWKKQSFLPAQKSCRFPATFLWNPVHKCPGQGVLGWSCINPYKSKYDREWLPNMVILAVSQFNLKSCSVVSGALLPGTGGMGVLILLPSWKAMVTVPTFKPSEGGKIRSWLLLLQITILFW